MMFDPPHPGLLIADLLENGELTIGSSVAGLARHLGVTRSVLTRVIQGKTAVSAEMALRLEGALGVKADMWLRLQAARDIWVASQKMQVQVSSVLFEQAA